MDVVILKDFEVKACHGVNPEEKINPQRFLFTAEIFTDFLQCSESDDLTKTISYSDVKKTLKSFCENNCFDLIETLAVRAAEILLKKYPLASKVKLTVKKPDAPMSGVFEYAGVRVEREWKTVYLALGSSMGDKGGYLDFAMERLLADDNFRNVKESARIVTNRTAEWQKRFRQQCGEGGDALFSARIACDNQRNRKGRRQGAP